MPGINLTSNSFPMYGAVSFWTTFTAWSYDAPNLIVPLLILSLIEGSHASRICIIEIINCSSWEGFSP